MSDTILTGHGKNSVLNRIASIASGWERSSGRHDSRPVRLTSIVTPLDGSEFAEHALPLAIAMAQRSGAVLRLLYVFSPFEELFSRQGSGPTAVLERYLRRNALDYLREVEERINRIAPDITLISQLVEARQVADAISQAAESADFIVMATRGRGWLGRVLYGSVTRGVIRRTAGPVVLVRGRDTPVELGKPEIPRHLVLPLNGAEPAERVIEPARQLARLWDARLTLLNVRAKDSVDERSASPDADVVDSGTYVQANGPKVCEEILKSGSPAARAVMDFARANEGDMIALADRGRGGWGRAGINSVIRQSPMPVLVLGEG